MKKEIPILFSTPMVQAILADRKTMTRRVIKPQPTHSQIHEWRGKRIYEGEARMWCWKNFRGNDNWQDITHQLGEHCPYGKPGDLLWVREAFFPCAGTDPQLYAYKGNWVQHGTEKNAKWKPSIHMPKAAARIWLEVTGVRVERLQDISTSDACDEGIEYWNIDPDAFEGGELQADFKNYTWTERREKDPQYEDRYSPTFASCIDSYRTLWQSINGPESWEANPRVWVIEFRVLSTKGKPKGE